MNQPQPIPVDLQRLALYDPIAAYGLLLNIPRVPIQLPIRATFSSFTVPQIPVVGDLTVTIAQRTWIQRIDYSLAVPNAFPGNIFKPEWDASLKQHPNIDVRIAIMSGPRYLVSPANVPLETVGTLIDPSWPAGWPLFKQQSIQCEFTLTGAPGGTGDAITPPYNVVLVFSGWQFLSANLDRMCAEDAREALNKSGIYSPQVCELPGLE